MGAHFLRDLATTWPPNTPTHQELLGAADSLDGLHAENKAFRSALQEAGAIESALRAEVERLRAAMLGVGLAITAYDASSDRARSDYDMVCAGGRLYDAVLGIHDSWKLGLDPQPLPAPPAKED